MEINIQVIFRAIREVSAQHMEPRPYIGVGVLEQELNTNIKILGPYLVHLKKMRFIIFNHKAMTAVKLTQMGLFWKKHHIIPEG